MKPVIGAIAFAAALSAGAADQAVSGPDGETASRPTVSIYFPAGTTRLTDEAKAVLDEAAQAAKESQASRVIVVGYDDTSGDIEASQRIAAERAASVEVRLVDRGIDPGIVSVVVAANPTREVGQPPFIDTRRADVIMESKATGITSGF